MVEWLSSFDPHTRAWCQDGGGCGIHWCAVCAPCQPHMFVSYCTFTSWHDDAESLQQPVLIANLMWFMYMRHIHSFKSWSTTIMWLITSDYSIDSERHSATWPQTGSSPEGSSLPPGSFGDVYFSMNTADILTSHILTWHDLTRFYLCGLNLETNVKENAWSPPERVPRNISWPNWW